MELKTHFLYPSTLFFSREPYIVNTILGSCVSLCLYDPINRSGGINHYMLPFWNGEGLASPKYGNIAIEKLLEKMLQSGSKKNNLIAKVFGGGEVIDTQISQFHIGERNIEVAQRVLKDLNIRISGQSLGGKNGRKIQFNTETGAVLQKMIARQGLDPKK
ncbi:MAG: chemotaxis protein CheD [Bacteroidetes bacterium]|nr:MAG: chemotaxis protein CheD [Bacteroidota bacterium]